MYEGSRLYPEYRSWLEARGFRGRGTRTCGRPTWATSLLARAALIAAPPRMSDVVIRAEGLGKKYLIGHQAEGERYTALRDVIARGARGLARSAADMLRGRPLIAGDAVEEFWALEGRVLRGEARRGGRHHRPQRRRQVHAAQDPLAHHRAERRPRHHHGPRGEPARGGHRLPPRADGAREHLPERRHPRHDPRRDRGASSTRSSPSPRSSGSSTRPSSATPPACTSASPSPWPPTWSPRS